MFGFFNKWRKAGRGVGISGGVDKLAAFDKDGNVVSSGIAKTAVLTTMYQHNIHWSATDESDTTFEIYLTVYSKSVTALDAAHFYSALPDPEYNPVQATGILTTPILTPAVATVHAVQKGTSDRIQIVTYMAGDWTPIYVAKNFGTFTDTVLGI